MRVEQAISAKILDVEGTLARFGGDEALFRDMTSIVLEDAPRLAQELRVAVLAADPVAIQMKAHALKGLVLGCGGQRTALAAQKLEDAGRDHSLQASVAQLAELEAELQQFLEAIRCHSRSGLPS
ncbi:MAG TPA: Hpt domain-containing protein [Lacipirellulaceae bacterium]|jgi:HPt (histidine-containing phosphotransfer) domain-containing protein|nr:Hpt domain-containing protein [Lacipirellulaceae bacterium]